MNGKLRYSTKHLLLVAAGVAVFSSVALFVRSVVVSNQVVQTEFDSEAWRDEYQAWAHGRRELTRRRSMIDDLRQSGRLLGKTHAEVKQLLGEPDAKFAERDFPSWDLVYFIGLERNGKFSLDDEFLLLRFDNSGAVIDVTTGLD